MLSRYMKGIQKDTVQNHCRVPPSPVSNKLTPCKRAEVYVNEPLRHTRILFHECSLEFVLLLKGNNTFTDTNFFLAQYPKLFAKAVTCYRCLELNGNECTCPFFMDRVSLGLGQSVCVLCIPQVLISYHPSLLLLWLPVNAIFLPEPDRRTRQVDPEKTQKIHKDL